LRASSLLSSDHVRIVVAALLDFHVVNSQYGSTCLDLDAMPHLAMQCHTWPVCLCPLPLCDSCVVTPQPAASHHLWRSTRFQQFQRTKSERVLLPAPNQGRTKLRPFTQVHLSVWEQGWGSNIINPMFPVPYTHIRRCSFFFLVKITVNSTVLHGIRHTLQVSSA
jgi:hypothetical protein